jgi:hypothetical protein
VNRLLLPLSIAVTALVLGVVIGRYSVPVPKRVGQGPVPAAVAGENSFNQPSAVPPFSSARKNGAEEEAAPATGDASHQDIVASLKAALSHAGTRQNYAALSKLMEAVDQKNLSEALSFAESLPRDEKSTMLLSLLIGKWAEFDPAGAVNYAQRSSLGASRNWLVGSALSTWADQDVKAAAAWAQQLPPGQVR